MIGAPGSGIAEQVAAIEKSVSTIVQGAEMLLRSNVANTEKSIAYVREMQRADSALERAIALALKAGLEGQATKLARKRAAISSRVSRQVAAIGANVAKERAESITALDAIFKLGNAPAAPLDGPYHGQLVALTLFRPIDAYGRFVTRFYLPWKGKKFDSARAGGCNIFTKSGPIVGRLLWPRYSAWEHYRQGRFTAFLFNTYVGQGALDPDVSTLKLDYDNSGNPRFLIRSVLDELVQITDDYYLGKAYLWRPSGHYKLAAFFALRKR